ncbi:MAG: DUF1653 domain-containing protein [Nanoarchaeota archaeon]
MEIEEPKVWERYRHFKGEDKIYEVIAVARDCNNPEEKSVIYRNLYETEEIPFGTIWFRSLEDFCSYTELNGKKVKRFTLIK